MINIGLTNTQLNDFYRIIWGNHQIRVQVHILDHEHKLIQDVSNRFVDGQVNFHVLEDESRDCEIELSDPSKNLAVYGGYNTYLKRMIQVFYSVADPLAPYWYTVPVFCGPVTNFSNNEFSALINASGKDSLAYCSVWNPKSWPKGTKVTEVITWILKNVVGEKPKYFNVPASDKKLTREFSLKRDSVPWHALKQLYGMMKLKIFYDGRGVLQYRAMGNSPVAGFKTHQLLTVPKLTYDAENFYNACWVEGGDPKGDKKIIRGFAQAPSSHPFSPPALGRNGVGRYYVKQVSDTSVVEQKDADNRAWEEMVESLTLNTNAEWEGIPFPLLEEYDLYRLQTATLNANFRFLTGTLPLSHDSTMSIGFKKKVTRKVRRKKRRNKGGNRKTIRSQKGGK